MGARTRLPIDQGTLDLRWQPHRVRLAYEYHDDNEQWFRAYGNEDWPFDAAGLMEQRFASINEHPITEAERKFRGPLGRRPEDHPRRAISHCELSASHYSKEMSHDQVDVRASLAAQHRIQID
jgi:hypothetical protein